MSSMVDPARQEIGHGLGASEIAAAVGLNRHKAPIELWLEKTGQRPPFAGNEVTDWGLDVEPSLRRWYVRKSERAVWIPPASLYHADHGWARGTPDGLVVRDDFDRVDDPASWTRGFEAKNVHWRSAHRWGEPGTDDVPMEYVCQAVWNMTVVRSLGADVTAWDLAASLGGEPPKIWTVAWDAELAEDLLERGAEFWERVVERRPPEIDGSQAWADYLAERYPWAREDLVEADLEVEATVASLRLVRETIAGLELDRAEYENRIKAAIGDRAGLKSVHGKITWKPSKPRTIVDWESVAMNIARERGVSDEELAARAAAVTRTAKPSRPFCTPRAWGRET